MVLEVSSDLSSIIEMIIALLLAIIAYYNKQRTAAVLSPATQTTTATTIQPVTIPLTKRDTKLSDATIRWLTFDATPENKEKIMRQIVAAEEQKLAEYQIIFDGGYYNISYGQLIGSAGNPSGK